MKIWLPWADSNQPFVYEDGAFMGLKRDDARLADRRAENYLSDLDNHPYSWLAHIVRFVTPFLDDYPIFERYLRDFHLFPKVMEFRFDMLKAVQETPFFWYLTLTHAWILATSVHVDCGSGSQMGLFTNLYNQQSDWSKFEPCGPATATTTSRAGARNQYPGGVLPGAGRAFGRVMDDDWQHALFTRPKLTDLTPETVRTILHNVNLYSQGLLTEVENDYYDTLEKVCRAHGFLPNEQQAIAV